MVKILFGLVMTLFSLNLLAQTFTTLPDNDLWMEDDLYKRSAVTEEMFNRIITIANEIYQPIARAKNEILVINRKWTDATVNANCSRVFGSVTVNMFGGLARREEINPEGFALVLCHELGHAYGGAPYIQAWREMSAEGQSDYYGTKVCHAQVMKKLALQTQDFPVTNYMENSCENYAQTSEAKREFCLRGLVAGQSLGNLLATLKKIPSPDYETPDTTVVEQTQLSYPATVQCRLDTYFNGVVGKGRPACWFKN